MSEEATYGTCPLCWDRQWPRYEAIASELEIGHDRKAHLIYEKLARASLSYRELTEKTDTELRAVPGIGPEYLKRIRAKVPVPGEEQLTGHDPRVLLDAARAVIAHPDPATGALRRAVAGALREAAEDYGRCARINARKNPGELPELPSTVSEALLAAARLYQETR